MFSENLKAMRKAKGYTQEELAIKLNVTRQTISKWEKGLSVPDVDFLFKIADVLSAWAVAGLIWSCQSTEQRPSGLKLSRNR